MGVHTSVRTQKWKKNHLIYSLLLNIYFTSTHVYCKTSVMRTNHVTKCSVFSEICLFRPSSYYTI